VAVIPVADNARVTTAATAGDPPDDDAVPRRRIVVLGSTGSVGTQALALVARHRDRFEVVGLSAGGASVDLLAEQAATHPGAALGVADPAAADRLGDLPGGSRSGRTVLTGPEAASRLVESVEADVVLNAITGSVGLAPTLAALRAGRTLALANKESLVAGGALVTGSAAPGQIVPVDSEHSAIAQCLRSGSAAEVARLVLTASGGPFRGWDPDRLAEVTVAQALAHPTWDMGPVVTINSATLVNKGLELIEAHLLFDVPYPRIEVVVHPQSVVHSMATFVDGSTIAQASPPDMALPIALGLSWPDRLDRVAAACDFTAVSSWTFEPVDAEAFPALGLARSAGETGGLVPAAFNAANEEAVSAFTRGELSFPGISQVLAGILDEATDLGSNPRDLADVQQAERWARRRAVELVGDRGTR
jgi:1-deoxy-D-xylulose-5-phosphate reductoisomerase